MKIKLSKQEWKNINTKIATQSLNPPSPDDLLISVIKEKIKRKNIKIAQVLQSNEENIINLYAEYKDRPVNLSNINAHIDILNMLYQEKENNLFFNILYNKMHEKITKICIDHIKANPTVYSQYPTNITQDPEIQALFSTHITPYWINFVKEKPSSFEFCPKEIKQTPEMQEIIKKIIAPYFAKKWQKHPMDYVPIEILEYIKNTPEIQEVIKTTLIPLWEQLIIQNQYSYANCPKIVKEQPEIKNVVEKYVLPYWIEKIKEKPSIYEICPLEIKKTPEIQEILKTLVAQEYAKIIKTNPLKYSVAPIEIQRIPDIKKIATLFWEDIIKKNPKHYYEKCPLEIKKTPEIQEIMLQHNNKYKTSKNWYEKFNRIATTNLKQTNNHLNSQEPVNPAQNFNLDIYNFEEKGLDNYDIDSIAEEAFIEAIPEDPYGLCPCGCKQKMKFIKDNDKQLEECINRFKNKFITYLKYKYNNKEKDENKNIKNPMGTP